MAKAKEYVVVNKRNGIEIRRLYPGGTGAATIKREGGFDNHNLVAGMVISFRGSKLNITRTGHNLGRKS